MPAAAGRSRRTPPEEPSLPTRRTLAVGIVALATAGLGVSAGPAAAAPTDGPRAAYVITVDRSTLPDQAAERARGLGGGSRTSTPRR